MKSIMEWYQNPDTNEPAEPVKSVSIEKEIEVSSQEEPEQEEDNVLMNEYENVLKSVGLSEYLRGKLANYLAMTQDVDLENFKKDLMKNELKEVVNELSKTIAEL